MGEVSLPRHMFLWSMAVIYMTAFASLYVQIAGLFGNHGVLPVRQMEPDVARDKPAYEQFQASPSLVWLLLGSEWGPKLDGQQLMELLCLLGALLALAAAVLTALRDSLVFLILWILYLSLCQVGRDFLSFPWDSLLLEAGFVTVFIAPLNLLRWRSSFRHHDAVTFWLARWLLFRLTFGSGVAKLASHSPSWWNLTAVSQMLQTQGSPTPLAWFAHQLPDWILRLATVGILVSEIVVPVLYFVPIRCLRLGAFYIQLVYQGVSMLTGNLTVLNLLSVALSFSLLDDEQVSSWLGHSKKKRAKMSVLTLLVELAVYVLIIYCTVLLFKLEINWEAKIISSKTAFSPQQFDELMKMAMGPSVWMGVLSLTWELVASILGCICVRGCFWKLLAVVQWVIFGTAAVAVFTLTLVPYTSVEQGYSSKVLPEVRKAHSLMERYRLVSSYALDSAVGKDDGRPELVLEGSMDKTTWTEIELMYKPGNVDVAPPVVAPYQARLDWQMWRAAQGQAKHSPWFPELIHHLLQGEKDVERLLQMDQARYPFNKTPPKYLRVNLFKYWFTKQDENGAAPQTQWWRRVFVEEFYPTMHLGDPKLEEMLKKHGLKEKAAVQPSHDCLMARALKQVRDHVQTVHGPLLNWSLLATVATICLLRSMLFRGLGRRRTKSPPVETKAKRPKEQASSSVNKTPGSNLKVNKENSEEARQHSDRSPRKRK
ncbi:lipase maturation factor 2-like [Lampris incognitus]|uniref:lipase maturation factor 2-like n=1 Tax=Lampris incognitus TaxID=2546036 RepID=UPI0024B4F67F|nr:lipase maturation factor 2-like [Lampris incognitus]